MNKLNYTTVISNKSLVSLFTKSVNKEASSDFPSFQELTWYQ